MSWTGPARPRRAVSRDELDLGPPDRGAPDVTHSCSQTSIAARRQPGHCRRRGRRWSSTALRSPIGPDGSRRPGGATTEEVGDPAQRHATGGPADHCEAPSRRPATLGGFPGDRTRGRQLGGRDHARPPGAPTVEPGSLGRVPSRRGTMPGPGLTSASRQRSAPGRRLQRQRAVQRPPRAAVVDDPGRGCADDSAVTARNAKERPHLGEGAPPRAIRRRPTLPGGLPPSTIGAGGLNGRVRDGNGCDSAAMATGDLLSIRCAGTDHCDRAAAPMRTPERARALYIQALGRLVPVG